METTIDSIIILVIIFVGAVMMNKAESYTTWEKRKKKEEEERDYELEYLRAFHESITDRKSTRLNSSHTS